jgi:predicted transcriptional regulator
MLDIKASANSGEKLDHTLVFFYIYKKFYPIESVAKSTRIPVTELGMYINHLVEKSLIETKDNTYKITLPGMQFCETDSFLNNADTPSAQRITICKRYKI